MKSHISYIFFVPTCRALPLLGILLVVGICYTGYKVPVVSPFGFECVYMNVALGFALIWHRFASLLVFTSSAESMQSFSMQSFSAGNSRR